MALSLNLAYTQQQRSTQLLSKDEEEEEKKPNAHTDGKFLLNITK